MESGIWQVYRSQASSLTDSSCQIRPPVGRNFPLDCLQVFEFWRIGSCWHGDCYVNDIDGKLSREEYLAVPKFSQDG